MKRCGYAGTAHRYADGMLCGADAARFEKHLGECAECAKLVSELTRMNELIERMPEARAGSALKERIMDAVAGPIEPAGNGFRNNNVVVFVRKLIPAAACLCIMLAFLVAFQIKGGGIHKDTISISQNIQVQTTSVAADSYFSGALTDSENKFVTGSDSQAVENFYRLMVADSENGAKWSAE